MRRKTINRSFFLRSFSKTIKPRTHTAGSEGNSWSHFHNYHFLSEQFFDSFGWSPNRPAQWRSFDADCRRRTSTGAVWIGASISLLLVLYITAAISSSSCFRRDKGYTLSISLVSGCSAKLFLKFGHALWELRVREEMSVFSLVLFERDEWASVRNSEP